MIASPHKLRVLLVEDQRAMAENIWEFLEAHQHVMDHAADGALALQMAQTNPYDVIVLDIGLPRVDGLSVCRQLREHGCDTPILMLTARDQLQDKIVGLQAGADDYLVKPFALSELAARLNALHVRRLRGSSATLSIGDLHYDPAGCQVTRDGKPLTLTPGGLILLEVLMRRSPHVVRYAELAQALWQREDYDVARLHTHVSLLRAAIDRDFPLPMIRTAHSFGYRILPAADA